jgi:hypothetical protein
MCVALRATLLNIPYRQRIAALQDVAYLPDVQPPPELGSAARIPWWRKVKLAVLGKCVDHLLSPLKELSYTGECGTADVGSCENVLLNSSMSSSMLTINSNANSFTVVQVISLML